MTPELQEKLRNIKLVVTDVDGVLTNDTLALFVPNEDERKEFELHADHGTIRLVKSGNADDEIRYFSSKSDRIEGYTFFTPDGIVVRECVRYDIPIAMMSGRRSPAVEQRAKDLGARALLGIKDKVKHVENMLHEFGVSWDAVLFLGNDVQDLSLVKLAGFSAAPSDAVPEIRETVDYVSKAKGGRGVLREVVQMMFEAKGLWQEIVSRERTLG